MFTSCDSTRISCGTRKRFALVTTGSNSTRQRGCGADQLPAGLFPLEVQVWPLDIRPFDKYIHPAYDLEYRPLKTFLIMKGCVHAS